jgi:hypothetical protein
MSMLWEDIIPESQSLTMDLIDWYHGLQAVAEPPSSREKLTIVSYNAVPSLSTPGIRSYDRRSGVFFPDILMCHPSWMGANPFSSELSEHDIIQRFTEKLHDSETDSEVLQRFMPMDPTNSRGNVGLCEREKKPNFLTQEQFLSFSTLRAFPHLQVRQLVVAMMDDLLPFQESCVQIIVKQLMFHIGEETWKEDLFGSWQGLQRFEEQLRRRAGILRQSPSDSNQLLLFGLMSSYLGQYDKKCLACAKEFALIARQWGDGVANEVIATEVASPEKYWKQAKFYGYALLCYSHGKVSVEDCFDMIELLVLFKNKRGFASEAMGSISLDQPILQMMAYRIAQILKCVADNKGQLTKCLGLVLDRIPIGLKWNAVVQDNGVFRSLR